MKRLSILLFALLMLVPIMGFSQNVKFDEDHKYRNVLSNCDIRVYLSGSQELNANRYKNFGAGIGVTKRVTDHWRLRAQGEISGFLANGFDRDARVMYGGSFDLMPFYVFGLTGFTYNPSDYGSPFNAAVQGGIGLQWKYFFIEAYIDRVGHGTHNGQQWNSTVSAAAGCNIPLGIMPSDAKSQQFDEQVHSNYGNLIQENRQLKSEMAHQEVLTKQLQDMTARNDSLFRVMDARLKACESENQILKLTNTSTVATGPRVCEPVYFEFASSEINYNQDRNIAKIAKAINESTGNYDIVGYCSNNGGDYSNQKLSENRAWAVYERLIEFGVDPDRLIPTGQGKTEVFSEFDDHSNQCVIVSKSPF